MLNSPILNKKAICKLKTTMSDPKQISVLNKKLVIEPLNRCRPIILHNRMVSVIKNKKAANTANLQFAQTLFKEDVMYESKPGDFLLGESQGKVIIVNKLNLATSGSRTIAYFIDRKPRTESNVCIQKTSDACIQKTSDNVVALIGQKNYDTLFSALCSVINQELKIRGILALLTLQKKFEDGSCQTTHTIKADKEPVKPTITETQTMDVKNTETKPICVENTKTKPICVEKTDTKPIYAEKCCQTVVNCVDLLFKWKQRKRHNRRTQFTPYVVKDPAPPLKVQKKLILYPDNYADMKFIEDYGEGIKYEFQEVTLDKLRSAEHKDQNAEDNGTEPFVRESDSHLAGFCTVCLDDNNRTVFCETRILPDMKLEETFDETSNVSFGKLSDISGYSNIANNTESMLKTIDQCTELDKTSNIRHNTRMIPTSTQIIPTSSQIIPTSSQMIPTSLQMIPTSTQVIPTSTQVIPTITQMMPTSPEIIPTSMQHIPISTQHVPTSTQQIPTSAKHIPSSMQIVSEIQNNLNATYITILDGTQILVPVKPEDHFHIATPEILNNVTNDERKSLLWYQAYIDWKFCLQRDEDDNLPIHVAVLNNDVDLLRRQCLVLRNRKESLDIPAGNLTSLQMSIFQNTPRCTSMLLQYGADPLVTDEEHKSALHLAAEGASDQLQAVVTHCRNNARNILQGHEDLWRPIFETSSKEELAKYLLDHMCKMVDSQGYTPLMLASKMGNFENVEILVAASPCSVNMGMPNSGNTALYLAVGAACVDATERSNKSKAADHFNRTIERLVEGGADPHIENHSGSNIGVLLQESNIGQLSMLIANKLSNKHVGRDCEAFVLVKDENGVLNVENVPKTGKTKKRKDSGVVQKESVEGKNKPDDVKGKPVILENIALPKIVAPLTPLKLKTAKHFKTFSHKDKLVAKRTPIVLRRGSVVHKNELITTNKNVVEKLNTTASNSLITPKELVTKDGNKYKPLKQLIYIRNKNLSALEEVTVADDVGFDRNDSMDSKDPLLVYYEVKKERDTDKVPVFDTVAVKAVNKAVKRKAESDSAGPSSKK